VLPRAIENKRRNLCFADCRSILEPDPPEATGGSARNRALPKFLGCERSVAIHQLRLTIVGCFDSIYQHPFRQIGPPGVPFGEGWAVALTDASAYYRHQTLQEKIILLS